MKDTRVCLGEERGKLGLQPSHQIHQRELWPRTFSSVRGQRGQPGCVHWTEACLKGKVWLEEDLYEQGKMS